MIVYGVLFAIIPIAIVVAILFPALPPAPNIEDSPSTDKSEQVIKEDKD